jgi:hypothetical protein
MQSSETIATSAPNTKLMLIHKILHSSVASMLYITHKTTSPIIVAAAITSF